MVDPDRSGQISYNEFVQTFGADIAGGMDAGLLGTGGNVASEGESKMLPFKLPPDWSVKKITETLTKKITTKHKNVQEVCHGLGGARGFPNLYPHPTLAPGLPDGRLRQVGRNRPR